ncbi:MAG: CDP-diacylglycerol--serine O-phosphatidyltransferase [Acidobacteria bacterium]|nr:CDP-diacylglycerol--serine O-phosphatidyltransferase [Acidobacteriota bacterium]MBI3472918.1 CDP-diacylglycerol--serine O-phosphatidyltransferase [Candidatus Solibacter usitatus]
MKLSERLIDPKSPDRRPRRAAYALPTFFTAGNVFLGYLSVIQSFQGALAAGSGGGAPHFDLAAKAIGAAVFLDGLDGRIARLTNTTSEFGKEIDSLADVISFGIAPAVLAFAWGVQFLDPALDHGLRDQIFRVAYFCSFLFLLCCAARLARFNVQKNPVPKNPGRPDRKYFVGLPTPAAAGLVAAVVYGAGSEPITFWPFAAAWLALLALLSFLMVSTWRYRSFKDFNLLRPRSPLWIILLGSCFYLIWNYSQPVLLLMGAAYVSSGIVIRIGGIVRRRLRSAPPRQPEQQVG